jgi:DNA modification methylase
MMDLIPAMAKRIELRPIDGLLPYVRNPRLHSDAQVAQLAASMAEFGWTNPVLVDGKGGVIAGHGRLLAARKLGLDQVPVIELAHLTETQKRAYIIADNQLSLNASWDEDLLRVELDALREADFDLDLTGFSDEDLDALLAGEETTNDGQTDDDAVPETPEEPVAKPGDIWLLGEHRLLCGDATDAASYPLVLGGGRADMVFTDPPYNVDYKGAAGSIKNDSLGAGFRDFLLAAVTPMLEHCRGCIYIAMSSSELHTLREAFDAAGGHWSTFVVWAKDRFTLGRADYQRQYEAILYGWKEGSKHHWCGDRNQGDLWQIKKPLRNDLHPTMKPVELVERAIRNSSRPGDVVLDPFAGSGTTLIAAEKSGRRACLMELDPKFADVIVRRWEEYTGGKAVLEHDEGKPV